MRRPAGACEIVLLGQGRFPAVRDRRLAGWIEEVARELAPEHDSFAVRLVGDRSMRAFNRDFRGADKTTDVLSFPGEAGPDGRHLGDVVISVPQAVRQARENGQAPSREIRRLVLHGLLHCLGYDHERDGGEMERLERRLRRRWLRAA
ncbi:MAG: rRNA maturation RNase YbeY [Thermoanaerobaculia bacterium]|nr:rRNA maturation RNase YbeY [Thermoanaerobaculia bacterium]